MQLLNDPLMLSLFSPSKYSETLEQISDKGDKRSYSKCMVMFNSLLSFFPNKIDMCAKCLYLDDPLMSDIMS